MSATTATPTANAGRQPAAAQEPAPVTAHVEANIETPSSLWRRFKVKVRRFFGRYNDTIAGVIGGTILAAVYGGTWVGVNTAVAAVVEHFGLTVTLSVLGIPVVNVAVCVLYAIFSALLWAWVSRAAARDDRAAAAAAV